MACVESGERVAAVDNAQIWGGEDHGCRGKITKRRLLAAGAIAGCTALTLGLYLGLSSSSSSQSGADSGNHIVGQASDPNAVGCYIDERHSRVLTNLLTDEMLTPAVGTVQQQYCGWCWLGA